MKPTEFAAHYLQRLKIYIDEVSNNKRTTGKREKQAIERYQRYLTTYDYREQELTKRLKFISLINLPLKKQGVKQIQLADWQVFLINSIYCFYHPGTDDRVIQQVVISAGGKIGKTSLTCLLSITNLLFEESSNNNIVITSVTTKQSQAILKYCKDIIAYSPSLSNLFKILHSNIICKANGATIMIFTNEAKKLQGLNLRSHFADEFFLTETIDEFDVKDIAFEKMSLQHNHLQFIIGTFGNTTDNHLAYNDFYLPCLNVLDGIVEADEMFIFFFQLDDIKQATDSNNWVMANPSLNLLQTKQELEKKFEKLKAFPSGKKSFFREKLNFWDESSPVELFLEDETIKQLAIDSFVPYGEHVIIGVDLASNRDTIDIALLHYDKANRIFTFHNIPIQPAVEKNYIKGNDVDLRKWFAQDLLRFKDNNYLPDAEYNPNGFLIPSAKEVMDEDLIFDIIVDISSKYKIIEVAYDSYNSAQVIQKLEAKKIQCTAVGQSIKVQSPVVKYLERLIYNGQVRLVKSPLVRWQAKNLVIYKDINGNMKFDKRATKSGAGSIDCWAAMLTALVLWHETNQQYVIQSKAA